LDGDGDSAEGWIQVTNEVQGSLYLIAITLVTLGIIWQAVRMIWNKSGVPLADLLKSIAIFIFVSTAGVALVQMGAAASDSLARVFLNGSADTQNLQGMRLDLASGTAGNGVVILQLFWTLLLFIGMLIQVFIIIIKDISVLVASGALVLAASGQFFNFSKSWLDKIIGSLITFLLYKPLVALMMNIAITMMNSGGLTGVLMGAAMIFGSALGISPLMKIFQQIDYSGGIGSGGGMGTGAASGRSGANIQAPSGDK